MRLPSSRICVARRSARDFAEVPQRAPEVLRDTRPTSDAATRSRATGAWWRSRTKRMKRVSLARAMRSGEGDQIGCAMGSQLAHRFAATEILVVRARAAFRRGPVDDLVRILDVARLAVHAVRRVDLQAPAALAVARPSRTRRPGRSSRTGCRIPSCSGRRRSTCPAPSGAPAATSSCTLPAKNTEASRSRGGSERSTPAAIRRGVVAELLQRGPVGGVAQRPGRRALQQRLDAGVDHREVQAALERGLEVAHRAQLAMTFGRAPARVVAGALAVLGEMLGSERRRSESPGECP